ncbi:ASCH domain-containing protein [Planctomicrobium sp. SH661]|uniref:ASCH domain-containing protein n=1 Tax=Planctomicrobium sp. SH661 TaxID=3448124 RepID=UPI003F5AE292
MKALTISQPFASLIADGTKFVENRKWECLYRGKLAIHAGKGTQYLTAKELQEHPHSCILAVCTLWDCLHVDQIRKLYEKGEGTRRITPATMAKIAEHEHTEGPFCWILRDVQKLETPIPCSGAQGLWDASRYFSNR